jgi:DNA-binding winged helix-turn-helix (wHTH) protein/Tol biopolymer transport system component
MPDSESQARKIRFGPYELDEAARELRKNGLSVHLQDQPWEVLRALLERPGEVVSREELRRRLWPDGTYVDYEQSLNKAVNKLREALCDSADKPRYVETVSRRGYRFVAAVELERPKPPEPEAPKNGPEAPKEEPAHDLKSAPSRARLWWAVALGLLVAAILVTGLWPVPAPRTRVTQLTQDGYPNNTWPAVHGGRILFASIGQARSQSGSATWTEFRSISTEGGEPRRERMPFLNPEYAAWSIPTDPQHAFILIGAAASGATREDLWLAGFDGSKPRRIAEYLPGPGESQYSVSPDLKTLLRSGKEGLFARPVDGGPERLLARIDWNGPSYTFWHPSGERIGFIRYTNGPVKVWEVKRNGSGMRPLLPEYPGEQTCAQWSPDGERLYFVSQGEIYMRGSRRWFGRMRRPEPQRLTAGSVSYSIPTEDPADARTVYAWGFLPRGESMKLDRKTGIFEPYLGGLSADCLDYSPDGHWIAYVSYPGRELWKCRRDGSDKVLLENALLAHIPRWSPDGKWLAFAATRKGAYGDPYRIYTIDPNGGKSEPVKGVKGPGKDPHWSPDAKKLVFAPHCNDVPGQDRHVSIVDLDTGQVQMVPRSGGLFSPRWSPDGKHLLALTCEGTRPVIYDFETGRWTNVGMQIFGFPKWSNDSRYVYGITGNPPVLARIEMATRKLEEVRAINEFRLTGTFFPGVSWTPDGEAVVLADRGASEIYRIDVER